MQPIWDSNPRHMYARRVICLTATPSVQSKDEDANQHIFGYSAIPLQKLILHIENKWAIIAFSVRGKCHGCDWYQNFSNFFC